MIALTLRHYGSRFGWEITAFWLISLANTFLLSTAGALLEIVALAWITVRLVLAEDGFRTSGGSGTRPVPRWLHFFMPLAVATAIVFFPAIFRGMAFVRLFGEFDGNGGLRQMLIWFFAFALPLKLFGLLILRGADGRAKTAAWAALALIMVPVLGSMGKKFANRGDHSKTFGDGNSELLAQGIQQNLTGARDFIGNWYEPVNEPAVPAAAELARISVGSSSETPAVSVRDSSARLLGSRVNVRLRALIANPHTAMQLGSAIPILRYADGTFATCQRFTSTDRGAPLPFFTATEWEFSGDFVSPLSLPEFESDRQEITRGLELLFFVPDWNAPWLPVDPVRKMEDRMPNQAFHYAPQTMEELFTQFPWPDRIWSETARAFLLIHAAREDVPFLLEKLRLYPRLAEVFSEKDWTADALPVLRALARQRIPLSPPTIRILAAEKDPTLAADLAACALQLNSGLADLEMSLRNHPGFDWPDFARKMWLRKKYTSNWVDGNYGEFWIAALWAAREGDESAFLKIAELASRGHQWERKQLPSLLVGEHAEPVDFVRENLGRLAYDPATKTWGH